jgi:flagellar assembly factor FliW
VRQLARRLQLLLRMPQILTHRFGLMEVDEATALHFPLGLPGFETHRRFALVECPAAAPLMFLQSLDLPELCFVAAPVEAIEPAYQLELSSDDLHHLRLVENRQPKRGEVVCLAILSAPENGRPTANLLAPVVIEPVSRQAVQAVRLDSRYSHQHALAVAVEACS